MWDYSGEGMMVTTNERYIDNTRRGGENVLATLCDPRNLHKDVSDDHLAITVGLSGHVIQRRAARNTRRPR